MRLASLAVLAWLALAAAAAAAPPHWPEDGRALLEPAPPLTEAEARAAEAPIVDLACLTSTHCAPAAAGFAPTAEPEPTAIPLPAALTLMGAGMATLAMLLRRRSDAG